MDNNKAFDRDTLEEKLNDPAASPIPLPLEFLKDITCNFSREQELGRGGYGVVYKGFLRSGKNIAVKKLFQNVVRNEDQFQKEVTNLFEIKHQNIVRLVGYCAEPSHELSKLPNGEYTMAQIPRSLLCFEYLDNASLDKYLSDESCGLDWNKRYEIIKGICIGLHFLHGECNIVHLDLKPENILLDCAMMPKIADFGLSKLLGAQKSRTIVSGNLPGTLGYMAPEYRMQGVVSPKADIFSFGVIIIEIITGAKEYPMCAALSFLEFNEYGSCKSTEISLKEYRDDVIGRWRNVFKKEPKHTSPEIYIEQVEQCIRTALECLKYDSTKRPTACDISQMLTGEVCSCQKNTLLSAQPFELRFHFTKHHEVASCPLQLTNNSSDLVAFRFVMTNDLEKYLAWPVHGLVLPRRKYNLRMASHRPLFEDDNSFTIKLESTIIDDHDQLLDIQASGSDAYNRLFKEAKNKGSEVQQVKMKLLFIAAQEIISRHQLACAVCDIFLHPTKTWIITTDWSHSFNLLDYQKQETVNSSEFLPIDHLIHRAIFIPRKQWFVVDYHGHIKVYSYQTMKEVKNFDAHDGCVSTFDIHPSEPYVLSSSYYCGTVKLWNWEKDWECVWKIEMRAGLAKFNPKDAHYIACATSEDVKVLNFTSSINNGITFSLESSKVHGLECLARGDKLYLITGHYDGLVMIWDWESRSCLKTHKEHTDTVSTICVHPDLPIVITGSYDGTVCLWNSFTFKLEDKLKYDFKSIESIACLKGSNRIVIGHGQGLAITEIHHEHPGLRCMLPPEGPQDEDNDPQTEDAN